MNGFDSFGFRCFEGAFRDGSKEPYRACLPSSEWRGRVSGEGRHSGEDHHGRFAANPGTEIAEMIQDAQDTSFLNAMSAAIEAFERRMRGEPNRWPDSSYLDDTGSFSSDSSRFGWLVVDVSDEGFVL